MSKRIECIPIIVFLLFIAVGISKAEPTPTTSYLMNTPVSMLDFGIYRLEKYFDSIRDDLAIFGQKPTTTVNFLYDQNRIVILLNYAALMESDFKNNNIKKEISERIKGIKAYCFNLYETEKPMSRESGTINRFFSHQGYEIKNQPKNIWKELEKITEIHVYLSLFKEPLMCKSPLIGNKVYWNK